MTTISCFDSTTRLNPRVTADVPTTPSGSPADSARLEFTRADLVEIKNVLVQTALAGNLRAAQLLLQLMRTPHFKHAENLDSYGRLLQQFVHPHARRNADLDDIPTPPENLTGSEIAAPDVANRRPLSAPLDTHVGADGDGDGGDSWRGEIAAPCIHDLAPTRLRQPLLDARPIHFPQRPSQGGVVFGLAEGATDGMIGGLPFALAPCVGLAAHRLIFLIWLGSERRDC